MGGFMWGPIATDANGQQYAAWAVLDPDQVTLTRQLRQAEDQLAALRLQLEEWLIDMAGEVDCESPRGSDAAA